MSWSLVYERSTALNEEPRDRTPISSRFASGIPTGRVLSCRSFSAIATSAERRECDLHSLDFPKLGQVFDVFRLQSTPGCSEVMSRVFLARDLSLGGKQVVLKVALDRGQEPKRCRVRSTIRTSCP